MRTRIVGLKVAAMACAMLCLAAVASIDSAPERFDTVSVERLDMASLDSAPNPLVADALAIGQKAQTVMLATCVDSRHRDRMWAMPASAALPVPKPTDATTVHDLSVTDLRPRPGWRYSI